MIRRPPRSTRVRSSAASDVYKRQYTINLKMMESLKKVGEMDLFVPKEFAYCLWQKGRTKEAEVYINQLIQTHLESIRLGRFSAITKRAQFDLAEMYTLLGNKEKAYYY